MLKDGSFFDESLPYFGGELLRNGSRWHYTNETYNVDSLINNWQIPRICNVWTYYILDDVES